MNKKTNTVTDFKFTCNVKIVRVLMIILIAPLFVWLATSCMLQNSTWQGYRQIIETLNRKGAGVNISGSNSHNLKDNKTILDNADLSITNTLKLDPAGFIIVFKEDEQAKLFIQVGDLYNNDPDTLKKYRFIRNRNAVLFVDERIAPNETQQLFSDFEAIEPQ